MWGNVGFFFEIHIEEILMSSSYLFGLSNWSTLDIRYFTSTFLYLENFSLQYYGINHGACLHILNREGRVPVYKKRASSLFKLLSHSAILLTILHVHPIICTGSIDFSWSVPKYTTVFSTALPINLVSWTLSLNSTHDSTNKITVSHNL
jgi:hypothetical protein